MKFYMSTIQIIWNVAMETQLFVKLVVYKQDNSNIEGAVMYFVC